MLYCLYKVGRAITLRLPIGVCYGLAVLIADVYYLFARQDRKDIEANLEVVLGPCEKKLLKKHVKAIFRNFAKYLADFFRFSKIDKNYIATHIKIEGKENLERALSAKKGAIALSAHLGNWELGAAIVAKLGHPFYAIVLAHRDRRVNDFFLEQRALSSINVIPVGMQLKKCFRVLKENSVLAIVGDRLFSEHGTCADFFDRPAMLPKGPALFSLRTGAPIVPTFLIRMKDDSFTLIFEKPITGTLTDDKKEDMKNLIEKYASVIAQYVKRFPDQWYAFRRVWD